MSLIGASIPVGGTLSVTGGTATIFTLKSSGPGVLQTQVTADAYAVRRKLSFSFKEAKKLPEKSNPYLTTVASTYTQQRSSVLYSHPVTITDPVTGQFFGHYNTTQITFSVHPLTTDADKATQITNSALLLQDADFTEFWKNGLLT